MKAKYCDRQIELTDEFLLAIEALMKADVAMMKADEPRYARSWYWGRCKISDLARADGMEFTYGSKEDMPDDGGGQFAVLVQNVNYSSDEK